MPQLWFELQVVILKWPDLIKSSVLWHWRRILVTLPNIVGKPDWVSGKLTNAIKMI
jgi:hypothetical protein